MKRTIITGLTFSLILLNTSCGDAVDVSVDVTPETISTESGIEVSTEINDTELTENEVKEEIVSKYNYDLDWEAFKEAVVNKDIQGMSAFAGSDEIDSEELLMLLSAEPYLEAIKNATYEDLKTVDQDGEILLEFSAEESGVDEDGNELESAVMLYFSQGDPSLVLEYYLAAG
jgi:hypothetical protein